MNRAFLSSLKFLLLATVALCGLAGAAEHEAAAPAARPAAARGGSLYAAGDAARGIPACASCHGAAGNSTIVTNPKLAGQIEAYVYKQLMDFTTPDRNNPIM